VFRLNRFNWQIFRTVWFKLMVDCNTQGSSLFRVQIRQVKDINKILAKTHFKCKKKWKNPYFCENITPCHAFTSPSCSLSEKSSLPIRTFYPVYSVSIGWFWSISTKLALDIFWSQVQVWTCADITASVA
jgi:hypothetical protein